MGKFAEQTDASKKIFNTVVMNPKVDIIQHKERFDFNRKNQVLIHFLWFCCFFFCANSDSRANIEPNGLTLNKKIEVPGAAQIVVIA